MNQQTFNFRTGNLRKLLAIPLYALSAAFSLCVLRGKHRWVFGSGIGFGEGALPLACELQRSDPNAHITWAVQNERDKHLAQGAGFRVVQRSGWHGFWATLRARNIVVTHGLGDVNRFGTTGAFITHLGHGVPLKKLHLDSPVTTEVQGPAVLRAVLRRMYHRGTRAVSLYVAGSATAADRLRSAYRVAPGKVQVLGDPRDDVVATAAADESERARARAKLTQLLCLLPDQEQDSLVLYAPTWRDGEPDPAIPSTLEAAQIREVLERCGARLVIRSHPLGAGEYAHILGDRITTLNAEDTPEITPLLAGFDALITDYSSIAIDYALLKRPVVWFAPDLHVYAARRGLYEPLERTASGRVHETWAQVCSVLETLFAHSAQGEIARQRARTDAEQLIERFHAYPEGGAARRVLEALRALHTGQHAVSAHASPDTTASVFFESFYGTSASCNPLALDREIARRYPQLTRYWSVSSERVTLPEGAVAVLVGSAEWHAARRNSRVLIVNDWLRYGFRRRTHQTVVQTWHGTMLKNLALMRPGVSLRTRLAIHRESRRWNVLLSQNRHSTEHFRRSYAFRGVILESGYPRDDRLAAVLVDGVRDREAVLEAQAAIAVPSGKRVLVYAPTWRERGGTVDMIDVAALARELGEDWVVAARGHSRSEAEYAQHGSGSRVIDVSKHADINDIILAADLLVTDYSSIMFDAAVARVPLAFFVPDFETYRDRERGFTFDFAEAAPGPLLRTRDELVTYAKSMHEAAPAQSTAAYEAWRERFTPHDNGKAAARVVNELARRGVFASKRP